MTNNTLYSIVSKAMNQAGNGKLPVGYTVSSYQSVLSALEKAKSVNDNQKQFSSIQSGRTIKERIYTILGETGLSIVDSSTTFVDGQYQGVCVLKDYMSFIVDVTNTKGKKYTAYVSNEKDIKSSKFSHVNAGNGVIENCPIFPASYEKPASYYTGLESKDSPFKIGVGLDISNFGLKFFQKFFPNIKWTDKTLKDLMSKSCIFAEVLLPRADDTTTADVLHALVTVNITDNTGEPFQLFIPIPLLLLNDYNSLGNVIVTVDNKPSCVGSDIVTNPMANKKYYHKTCSIEDFTPNNVERWTSDIKNGVSVSYLRTDLCSGNKERKGRVRLFLDKDKKDVISSVIGEIPKEYEIELFKGKLEDKKVIKTDTDIINDVTYGGDVYFPDELAAIITKDKYLKVLQIIKTIESGNNFKSAGYTKWDVAGDGAGISYGMYQTTGKSGGLTRLIDLYINDSNSNSACVANINTYKNSASSLIKTEDVERLMDALKYAGDTDPNMAYIQTKHMYNEQIENKGLIKSYTNAGLSSPLGFLIALHCYNQGRPKNFWDGISSLPTEKDKCSMILSRERNYLKSFHWWKEGGNHDRYTTDFKVAIDTGNFDLSQTQRWCNASF